MSNKIPLKTVKRVFLSQTNGKQVSTEVIIELRDIIETLVIETAKECNRFLDSINLNSDVVKSEKVKRIRLNLFKSVSPNVFKRCLGFYSIDTRVNEITPIVS